MGCALRYSDYATRIFAEAERSRVALQGYFVATAVAIRVMEGVANALDPDVADLFGNQPLRRELLENSRTALSRPRRTIRLVVERDDALVFSATRVEEASSLLAIRPRMEAALSF